MPFSYFFHCWLSFLHSDLMITFLYLVSLKIFYFSSLLIYCFFPLSYHFRPSSRQIQWSSLVILLIFIDILPLQPLFLYYWSLSQDLACPPDWHRRSHWKHKYLTSILQSKSYSFFLKFVSSAVPHVSRQSWQFFRSTKFTSVNVRLTFFSMHQDYFILHCKLTSFKAIVFWISVATLSQCAWSFLHFPNSFLISIRFFCWSEGLHNRQWQVGFF